MIKLLISSYDVLLRRFIRDVALAVQQLGRLLNFSKFVHAFFMENMEKQTVCPCVYSIEETHMTETEKVSVKPVNTVTLYLSAPLLTLINAKSGEANQYSATWIMKLLTEHFKDEIITRYGQQTFDALVVRYSQTSVEQTEANNREKEEHYKRKLEKLELLKRELAIKEKNASTYGDIAKNASEKREMEKKAKEIQIRNSPQFRELETKQKLLESGLVKWQEKVKTEPFVPFGVFQTREQLQTAIPERMLDLAGIKQKIEEMLKRL
jgi:hypothetical protein